MVLMRVLGEFISISESDHESGKSEAELKWQFILHTAYQ